MSIRLEDEWRRVELTIHFLPRLQEVLWVRERYEAILGLRTELVSNYASLCKGRVFGECLRQHFIRNVVAEVAYEQSEPCY